MTKECELQLQLALAKKLPELIKVWYFGDNPSSFEYTLGHNNSEDDIKDTEWNYICHVLIERLNSDEILDFTKKLFKIVCGQKANDDYRFYSAIVTGLLLQATWQQLAEALTT